jgi:plasmid stabilization system protein ParE
VEFERSAELLTRHPRMGSLWRHGKRRVVTRRFPFSILYTVVDDQVRILAVAHHSRHPGHWRSRK